MWDYTKRDQLLIKLYESILAPNTALETIEEINHWLDCDGIHMVGWHKQTQDFSISITTRELSANAGHYSNHYRRIDPRWDAVRSRPEGLPLLAKTYLTTDM